MDLWVGQLTTAGVGWHALESEADLIGIGELIGTGRILVSKTIMCLRSGFVQV